MALQLYVPSIKRVKGFFTSPDKLLDVSICLLLLMFHLMFPCVFTQNSFVNFITISLVWFSVICVQTFPRKHSGVALRHLLHITKESSKQQEVLHQHCPYIDENTRYMPVLVQMYANQLIPFLRWLFNINEVIRNTEIGYSK